MHIQPHFKTERTNLAEMEAQLGLIPRGQGIRERRHVGGRER